MYRPQMTRGHHPLKDTLRSTMRSEEAKRVAKFRTKRATEGTNPMHKALYVRAMVDAQEELSQRRRELSTVTAPVQLGRHTSSAPDVQLELLAEDLQSMHRRSTTSSSMGRSGVDDAVDSSPEAPVPFGSWREVTSGAPSVDRRLKYQQTALHCIVDGALTPAAYAPAVLRAGLPTDARSSAMRSVTRCILTAATRRANTEGLHRSAYKRAASLLSETLLPRVLSTIRPTVPMAHATEADGHRNLSNRQKLLCDVLGRCGAVHWRLGVEVLTNVIASHSLVRACMQHEAMPMGRWACPSVTVMLEAIRRHHGHRQRDTSRDATPPPAVLRRIVGHTSPPLLEHPTGVAPLVALMDRRWSWEEVLACCGPLSAVRATRTAQARTEEHGASHTIEGSGNGVKNTASKDGNVYLPPIALGQLLRALHRTGAPLARVQAVLDRFTDPMLSKNAPSHMRHHHVYGGYIAGAPWVDALEVYDKQAPHYGTPRTSLLTASTMEALRAGATGSAVDVTSQRLDVALQLYTSLRRDVASRRNDMVVRTADTVCEALEIWRLKVGGAEPAQSDQLVRAALQALVQELGALSALYGCDSDAVPSAVGSAAAPSDLDRIQSWLRQLQQDETVAPRAVVGGLRLLNAVRRRQHAVAMLKDYVTEPPGGGAATVPRLTTASTPEPPAEISADMLADLMSS